MPKLRAALNKAQNDAELFEAIVNSPFLDPLEATHLDLGIIVFLQVNKKQKTIDRIALSNTDLAKGAVRVSAKPFKAIKIPLDHSENLIAETIRTKQPHQTGDWQYLFTPALTPSQARMNQSGAGIECSMVYPLTKREGGALIFSFFQPPQNITEQHRTFATEYTELVNNALSN
jgi:hypothetical protein